MPISFHSANHQGDDRVGHYTLAESDRYTVSKHVGGEQDGYSRIVATVSPFTLVYDSAGKVKEKETLWLTPRLVAGPVKDVEHCLEIWLRETMLMSRDDALLAIPWLVSALHKGAIL